ncbi:ChbG/HpnK family deacetylase [Alphaproteobacteria bacterium]|nr:ChbG/HpnK family deacetylase [Alphaproteobacteria bacterium]
MSLITLHIDDYGRSPNVSKQILDIIKYDKKIEVSVMIGFVEKEYHIKMLNKNVKTRLHLNLTDNKSYFFNKNKKNTNFIDLLFLKKKFRKHIFKEIDKQIKEYSNLYKLKKIRVDGHEHVQFIPWIYDYLDKYTKFKITEIRYSAEKFYLPKMQILLNKEVYKNFIGFFVIKILSLFNKKKTEKLFYGLLYSGIMDKEIYEYIIKKNINKNLEILFHIGFTNDKNEKKFFTNKYFKYFSDEKRISEKNEFLEIIK